MSPPHAFEEVARLEGVEEKQASENACPLAINAALSHDSHALSEESGTPQGNGKRTGAGGHASGLDESDDGRAQSQDALEHLANPTTPLMGLESRLVEEKGQDSNVVGSAGPTAQMALRAAISEQEGSLQAREVSQAQDATSIQCTSPPRTSAIEEEIMDSSQRHTPLPPSVSENEDAGSEIQSIIDQFDESVGLVASYDNSTPSSPHHHPTRTSSLGTELVEKAKHDGLATSDKLDLDKSYSRSGDVKGDSKPESLHSPSVPYSDRYGISELSKPMSPLSPTPLHKALPPAPEPELPFDFHRFLDQLRHRTADPVAKFLRSFLFEFGKKQWMVHEQVKIISDFLSFITGKMSQCDVWKEVSDAEFDNAREGMEKLVMNRLYSQTFSPAIPPPVSSPIKGKRKGEAQLGPYRKGQHQEDIERDAVLAQKVRIYGWIRPEHLDIPFTEEGGTRFLLLAQQELLKIKSYRAPRDKVICVLNCCKVIFGLLRNSKSRDTSADAFMPLLIYVILQANPEHLVSNIQYILRFRNQDKLGGEAGYYISSLMGAIQFIENLDRTSLTITDEDFEKNVEAAVSTIAERETDAAPASSTSLGDVQPNKLSGTIETVPIFYPKPTLHEKGSAKESTESTESTESGSASDEQAAVSGLLRSIKRPLSNIGRLFTEEQSTLHYPSSLRPQQANALPPQTPRRLSPTLLQAPPNGMPNDGSAVGGNVSYAAGTSAEDAAARQASAEVAEAQRIHRAEHKDVVETLAGMFPNLDRDVIDDVVRLKEGRVGSAVDACLALNTDT